MDEFLKIRVTRAGITVDASAQPPSAAPDTAPAYIAVINTLRALQRELWRYECLARELAIETAAIGAQCSFAAEADRLCLLIAQAGDAIDDVKAIGERLARMERANPN
jgi:hypothetical protein